jgi:uncharacterized OsmC-like protein
MGFLIAFNPDISGGAKAMYHVDIINEGAYAFKAVSKDGSFRIDTDGGGITPPDTFLAGLGSCIGVYLRKYCDGSKIQVNAFTVTVEGELEKTPPARFREIRASIDLKGASIDERRKDALIQFIKNCPVHNTIKHNPDISIEIK